MRCTSSGHCRGLCKQSPSPHFHRPPPVWFRI
uniref:Uncharacterized protein n=1 Tax=Anguilla anguilla TaxID=7936 RepID=A0A0E9TSV4_ANGAN